ncbi:MAG TPA: sigma-70 family RNA polymerase sigma factor [Blastocatellia bacterium]
MRKKSQLPETEAEFNAILEKYGAFLRQTIARICPKDLGIQFDDIEQEARLRLWRAIEAERKIDFHRSYIYKIVASVTINAIRRAKARREEQLRLAEDEEDKDGAEAQPIILATVAESSPEAQAERDELLRKVEEAMARLPENRRLAVGLYLKGMTTDEIADLMEWSEPKARNLVYRGLKDLRGELRDAGIEYG